MVKTEDNKTILQERKGRGIWQGLYEFPKIESASNINKKELISSKEFVELFPEKTTISLFNKEEIVHKLSHQHLHTQFWIVETEIHNKATISWSSVKKYPVPVLIANFLEKFITKSN